MGGIRAGRSGDGGVHWIMPTRQLDISGGDVGTSELAKLADRATTLVDTLRQQHVEARLPIGFEFSGSPKAGKSSIIGLVSLLLRRSGFRVSTPPEGASIETPPDLKEDLLAFNAWCGCYAIQNILVRSHEGDPYDVLLLDRGLFDWVVWMRFLRTKNQTIDQSMDEIVSSFALAEPWLGREKSIFLFTADISTSLSRELRSQLTTKPGRAMNQQFLADLHACYDDVILTHAHRLPEINRIDTSFHGDTSPSFQRIAYVVVNQMLDVIEEASSQTLLVVPPVPEPGVIDSQDVIDRIRTGMLNSPIFVPRAEAEQSLRYQQVVPYGVLKNTDGRYLCAKRRSDERPQLANKITMLFGGHAESRDWNSGAPEGVLDRCLRRELGEELIGVTVKHTRLMALVNDRSSAMGKKHLAFIHEVDVGGKVAIRRQTADREFTRDGCEWKTQHEIVSLLDKLDPWSQLMASRLFHIPPPPDAQSLLFGVD